MFMGKGEKIEIGPANPPSYLLPLALVCMTLQAPEAPRRTGYDLSHAS